MKFGIELECYDVDMDTVATTLNSNGIQAAVAGYMGRAYNIWQIKTDGSISGRNGFEVVSPVLEGEEGIQQVRKVCRLLNDLNAKVNTSCGFHVHHDASNWKLQEFRNLFKRFIKFEDALDSVQPESRRGDSNRYIMSIKRRVTVEQIDSARSIRRLSELFSNNRYFKLNMQSYFRSGSVEFRNHAGTTDPDKVENYIRLTYAMVADAQDHVAVKPFSAPTTTRQALDTMLSGMVRRGRLTKQIAIYYQNRCEALSNA